jgi:hypothetical protein
MPERDSESQPPRPAGSASRVQRRAHRARIVLPQTSIALNSAQKERRRAGRKIDHQRQGFHAFPPHHRWIPASAELSRSPGVLAASKYARVRSTSYDSSTAGAPLHSLRRVSIVGSEPKSEVGAISERESDSKDAGPSVADPDRKRIVAETSADEVLVAADFNPRRCPAVRPGAAPDDRHRTTAVPRPSPRRTATRPATTHQAFR